MLPSHMVTYLQLYIIYIYDLTVGKCEEQTAISEEELIHRSQWAREPRNRGVDFISDSQFLSD